MMGKSRVAKAFDRSASKNIGYGYDKITSVANTWIFQDFINPTDSVLHFLCGGGYLLASLECGDKYGVELNPKYADHAQSEFGIRVAPSLDAFNNLDVVIIMHTLAQQPDPVQVLADVHKVLREGGTFLLLVPCYNHKMKYVEPNYDQHLFSWSPMDIGNLVHRAGFSILSVERICHRIPPKGSLILKYSGERLFHLICKTFGWLFPTQTQIRVLALKRTPGRGADAW
jgi:SAM-dependent methyltransferase